MPSVETAVVECERVTDDDRCYYSQPDRMTEFGRDCSSMIGRALVLAGFDYPSGWSPSTREMKGYLERIGWVWHDGLTGVHRGCILWKSGHTAMATSETSLAEALMSETHGIDGEPGDQTGWEIRKAPISCTTWAGYWNYPEEDDMTDQDKRDMTDQDKRDIIDGVVDAIVNFEQNGVKLRDRWQGTDEAACEARRQLTRTDDPTGRDVEMNLYEHAKWMAKAEQDVIDALDGVVEALADLRDRADALEMALGK